MASARFLRGAGVSLIASLLCFSWPLWRSWSFKAVSSKRNTQLQTAPDAISKVTIAAPTEAVAQRIPLLDLFSEATERGWVFSGNRDALYKFTQSLRQVASEGNVTMWGIDVKKGIDLESAPSIYVIEKIDPSYFKIHWIDTHQGWMHNKNSYFTTSRPWELVLGQLEPNHYCDLHVDREQALAWLSREGGDRLRALGSAPASPPLY